MTVSALRQQALRLLARREHSRVEMAQKLSASGRKSKEAKESTEEITAVLDHLEHTGLLSDQRMAEAYLRSHAARLGKARLRMNLRAKGVAAELIEQCLAHEEQGGVAMASESERALQVWQSKFGQAPENPREWARQARFLQARGFSSDIIRALLKNAESAS